MNAVFIAAVVDTLLPGDSGRPEGEPALPAGSAAGIDLDALAKAYHAVFDAIARQAGSAAAFTIADDPARIVAVQAIERTMPVAFRALLSYLLAEYYESTPVLTAMGWRSGPPQPQGHEMSDNDGTMAERLNRVRTRSKHWRGA
jgi:hypothetical protein